MRGRTTPRLRTALVGAAASVALVAGVGFVATTPDVSTDDVHLVQAEGASLVQGQEVNIDLKKLVEAQIGQEVPEGTTLKLNGLPEGLKQDGWNITGTPTESGFYNVRVEVSSGGETSTQEVQLMVAAPSGEEPNAPTETEKPSEDGKDGAEGEKSGESETTGEGETEAGGQGQAKPQAMAQAQTQAKSQADGQDKSADAEATDDAESTTTTTSPSSETEKGANDESGTSDEESSTPSSTPKTETDAESDDQTSESTSPKFPTEEEAFGEDGTDSENDEGTEIDLDEATGSLTDGMLGGSGSLEGSTGGEDGPETCETEDLTAGLEKFLPVAVGEQDDSGMITSIITSVLGTLLPTVLNTASSGNGSVCDAGGATGSILESAAGFADAQQGQGADAQQAESGVKTAGAQAAGGTTTIDSLLGGDGTQLMELMKLASDIMEQVPADGAR
ncbi:MAG TPA: hypothetical protein K8V11_06135 [Dietzia timorensis]|uniref:Uncharacterized protein n=1 Tax=Dietzia timorensis TaxID=499555 RepID=A0A921F5M8_9ACTN|nr:hypothetical protein [Dietzia timorensis]HJE90569.1 hypothetical protein [Dietzia timorensis]